MPRGQKYATERRDFVDPWTGLTVRQMTTCPEPTIHMHYESTTFTPDAERMIYAKERADGSGTDLYTVRTDGEDVTCLSDDEGPGMSGAVLAGDDEHVYYQQGPELRRAKLDGTEDIALGALDGTEAVGSYRGIRSFDGKYVFTCAAPDNAESLQPRKRQHLVRWDVSTGDATIVGTDERFGHLNANPGGPEVYVSRYWDDGGKLTAGQVAFNAESLESIPTLDDTFNCLDDTAHSFWLGTTNRYQGTLQWPGHGIVIIDRGCERTLLADTQYFWHSGASLDGKWVIADTHYPDRGIWLINVATRKKARLCYAFASQDMNQWCHPHPNLSDDGRYAVFNSDRDGVPHTYVIDIPAELRGELASEW